MQTADPLEHINVHSEQDLEPRYVILVHNDDVTPYSFVVAVLMVVFKLSQELAEHVTHVAHTQGVARVLSCPRKEAEKLVLRACAIARMDGFPLAFSLEPDE
jgi:ATP-dependent Clp protease adaptor protein ClpS